jgi:multimeric flavodoxin WrbA
LTILGSPRRNGNTDTILERVEEPLRARHGVQRLLLPRRSVHSCLGCEACQRILDAPGCVQRDEIAGMLEQILDADMIV